MKERLLEICTLEQCSSQVISHIDDVLLYSDGDMRRAITTMQSVHSIVSGATSTMKSTSSTSIMSSSVIAEIVGVPPIEIINQLWDTCTKQSSYDIMNHGVEHIIASGFSAQLILSALLTRILSSPPSSTDRTTMDDNEKNHETMDELSISQIAIRIAEAEKNMIDGADEYLQLMTVCSLLFTCFNK
jgi:replication factor C subunit 2/4